jgi:ribonuclease D
LQPFEYVDTNAELNRVGAAWNSVSVLGLDTEFIRERTFEPIAGLIQVNAEGTIYLLDCVKLTDFSAFAQVLANPNILKLLHSGTEDLQVFAAICATLPRPVFDTQIAAAFAGLGASVSYQRLVAELTGVTLAKDQTRSDWLARPLSANQLEYASLDVVHLIDVYQQLVERIAQRGFTRWCEAEMARVMHPQRAYPLPEEMYKKVKGASRLNPLEQHRLRALATWREEVAIARDVPRNHIVRDVGLLGLARRPLYELEALRSAELLHPAALRKYGLDLLGAVEDFDAQRAKHGARAPLLQALDKERSAANIASLQALVESRAAQLDLPTPLLARKRDLEALACDQKHEDAALLLSDWRYEAVGRDLLAFLENNE